MAVVDKALWLIEGNLQNPVSLREIAAAVGVSEFHLCRAFTHALGQPVMRYLWRRRLTRAAEALVGGRESVLMLALEAGYAGPEAFARAFRAEFGLSPRALRAKGGLDGLELTQARRMTAMTTTILGAPKVEVMASRRFAGPVQRYTMQTRSGIPAQWVAYNRTGERVPGAGVKDYYGLSFGYDEAAGSFDYLCGQEVAAGAALPSGFGSVGIEGAYARFATQGHISTMQAVWEEVYGVWLLKPEYRARRGASVEYYPPQFDGMTGAGGFEVWVPVEG